MACQSKKCSCKSRPNPVVMRPDWANARLMILTNTARMTPVTLSVAGTYLVAGNNPTRWAIGFINAAGSGGSPKVGPMNNPVVYGVTVPTATGPLWYQIQDYGPFVQGEWYCNVNAAAALMVFEVLIL